MPTCSISLCTSNCTETSWKSYTTFHRFPADKAMRDVWIEKCAFLIENFEAIPVPRICSEHFVEEDYERDLKAELLGEPSKRRLKKTAFPSVNLFKVKDEPVTDWMEIDDSPVLNDVGRAGPSREISPINDRTTVITLPVAVSDLPVAKRSHQEGPSSLPAIENFPGDYEFNVTFGPQEQVSKAVTWTYSQLKEKLYVGKDAACPINFSTSHGVPDGTFIRAMALYSSSEHVSLIVHRCYNHSFEESSRGLAQAEHLVRCECDVASYETDSITHRHSVVVPFENPPVGQWFSTYIFKFACFGSCAGGPNRRPLMVVFTLERDNQVLGRKRLDVKICACPGRDRKSDEQQSSFRSSEGSTKPKRKETDFADLSETFDFIKSVTYPSSKKPKASPNDDGYYTITVKDPQSFAFLKSMKTLYEMCAVMKTLSPEFKRRLLQLYSKSDTSESE